MIRVFAVRDPGGGRGWSAALAFDEIALTALPRD